MSRETQHEPALVLFSGGQDSATCLAWALDRFDRVETIGFDYGQRHRVELECRSRIADRLRREFPDWGAKLGEDRVVDLGVLGQISDTAMTRETEIAFAENGLPNTFRARTQPVVFHARRGGRVSARAAAPRRRDVRDRLFRLPRLPRRHAQIAAGDAFARDGPPLRHPHPADVARQGGDVGTGARVGRGWVWWN